MGPPRIPLGPLSLYLTAKSASEYFVAIPKIAVNHIQKTAPGPPNVMAVATPTILPMPTVAARLVIKLEKCERSPFCSDLLKTILKAKGSVRN